MTWQKREKMTVTGERLEGQHEHQRSGRVWRWLKGNKLFLIIRTGQF